MGKLVSYNSHTVYISLSPMNFDLFTGIAALSFFTSGKYVVDPELRGTEFERITQNLDMQFWKTFWNITETELLSVSASMLCASMRTNKTTSVHLICRFAMIFTVLFKSLWSVRFKTFFNTSPMLTEAAFI